MEEAAMSHRKLTLAIPVVAALAALAAVEIAIAESGNRPRTDTVMGTFTASPVRVSQRICEGQDGPYLELRGKLAGTVVSADSRLSGDFEFTSEPALISQTTGLGTFTGHFSISDPLTSRKKVQGEFHAVVTEGSNTHGFALAKVIPDAPGPPANAEFLFANFKSTFDAALNVTGEFGGTTGDARTPAVVQAGACSSSQ